MMSTTWALNANGTDVECSPNGLKCRCLFAVKSPNPAMQMCEHIHHILRTRQDRIFLHTDAEREKLESFLVWLPAFVPKGQIKHNQVHWISVEIKYDRHRAWHPVTFTGLDGPVVVGLAHEDMARHDILEMVWPYLVDWATKVTCSQCGVPDAVVQFEAQTTNGQLQSEMVNSAFQIVKSNLCPACKSDDDLIPQV